MPDILIIPAANADNDMTGAVVADEQAVPGTVSGLTNGTAYVARVLGDKSAQFTPAVPPAAITFTAVPGLPKSANDATYGGEEFTITEGGIAAFPQIRVEAATGPYDDPTLEPIVEWVFNGGANVETIPILSIDDTFDLVGIVAWLPNPTPGTGFVRVTLPESAGDVTPGTSAVVHAVNVVGASATLHDYLVTTEEIVMTGAPIGSLALVAGMVEGITLSDITPPADLTTIAGPAVTQDGAVHQSIVYHIGYRENLSGDATWNYQPAVSEDAIAALILKPA